jgi:hypothetical protein
MAISNIVDVSSGAAQAVGRYFSIISVVPSSLYVVFVYLLVESGSWTHSPNWDHAFTSLEHLSFEAIALLALFAIGLGVFIHPIQFAIVQFFEGYWGTSGPAQAFRAKRILHYQQLCDDLREKRISVRRQLADARTPAAETSLNSELDEGIRIRDNFPQAIGEIMPTRLGNILRRAESQAGKQYKLKSLQIVPQLLLIAPAGHVDYVNDQRVQMDLAVRMTFLSAVASATAILFLWPYGLWLLLAIIPYGLTYLSYRGAIVAAGHYGFALETLINLDRFELYKQLHLPLPATTAAERDMNEKLTELFGYDDPDVSYEHHVDPSP